MSRPVASAMSADGVGEAQQPWAGQLVDLADMAVLGEGGRRDLGDVVGVDERLGCVSGREHDLAAQDRVQQVALTEVLA